MTLRVRRLARTLEHIHTVRMATGIIMASCDLSEPDAMGMLTDRARREGAPLNEVAQAVIETGDI